MKIGEAVYKAQSETAAPPPADAKSRDKLLIGEFEEVDEQKKSA